MVLLIKVIFRKQQTIHKLVLRRIRIHIFEECESDILAFLIRPVHKSLVHESGILGFESH